MRMWRKHHRRHVVLEVLVDPDADRALDRVDRRGRGRAARRPERGRHPVATERHAARVPALEAAVGEEHEPLAGVQPAVLEAERRVELRAPEAWPGTGVELL